MYGFVIWVDRARQGRVQNLDVERADDCSRLSGTCFGLYARPFFSTPEAIIEQQPLVTPRAILSYSGHIDNRQEIADLLGQPQLAVDADGSVMLAAYEAWGNAFAAKLHGEFSFVLVDRDDGKVVAGRDALGIHKLYVLEDARRLWLASNLTLLLASVPEEPRISQIGAAQFIGGGATLGPLGRTLFHNVNYVGAGHILVEEGGLKPVLQRRFWTPAIDSRARRSSMADYEDALRTLLFNSVESALRAPAPVCTELSGGLDSSTVTVSAAVLRERGIVDQRLVAFSLVASDTQVANESQYQRQVLSQHDIEYRRFDLDSLTDVVDVADVSQPSFVDIQGWFLDAQRRLAAEYSPAVCLTGQGGDAVFATALPPLHLARLVSRWKLNAWAREVWKLLGTGRYNLWNLLWVHSRGDVLNAFAKPPPVPSWLKRGARKQVWDAVRAVITGTCGRFSSSTEAFHYSAIATLAASLPDQERFPWEFRCPLLARPLVEFMISVPTEYKVGSEGNRVLQRQALANVLPETIVRRRSKGDFTPRLFSALRRRWDFWEPLTYGTYLADLGLVDPAKFRSSCEALRQGLGGEMVSYLGAALILERWLRTREIRLDEPGIRQFRRRAEMLA